MKIIRDQSGKVPVGVILVLLALIGGAAYYFLAPKSDLPSASVQDVNEQGFAMKWDQQTGTAYAMEGSRSILKSGDIRLPTDENLGNWKKVKRGDQFKTETLFHLPKGGFLQTQTVGNWIFLMDGEGEFAFEDSRKSSDGKTRTARIYVRRGQFRAKPHDRDPNDHWLEVVTNAGKIVVHKGEIGLRVGEEGIGQIWLMTGEAKVTGPDGKTRDMKVKTLDYLK